MDMFRNIAERAGGDIHVGVVGPARVGKSALVRKLAEHLVLRSVTDVAEREQIRGLLPVSEPGNAVVTKEPVLVPPEPIRIDGGEGTFYSVRIIDGIGYPLADHLEDPEEHAPETARSIWFGYELPFGEAAEYTTQKIMAELSTFGFLVTTDGSFGEIPRTDFVSAEASVIQQLKTSGKPFVVILNSSNPYGSTCTELAAEIEREHEVTVIPMDVLATGIDDVRLLMEQMLYEFPAAEITVNVPPWIEALDPEHWLKQQFRKAASESVSGVRRLREIDRAINDMKAYEWVSDVRLHTIDSAKGVCTVEMTEHEDSFYKVLEEIVSSQVRDKRDIVTMLKELVPAKREYDKVKDALKDAFELGYGLVPPQISEMAFDEPEILRQGNKFAVRLKASAPSLHFIRTDVVAEVSPLTGSEKGSGELVRHLFHKFEEDPRKVWSFDIFGKSMAEFAKDIIKDKAYGLPESTRIKLQEALTRIVNEGHGSIICVIV